MSNSTNKTIGGVVSGVGVLVGQIGRVPVVVCSVSSPVSAAGPVPPGQSARAWVSPLIPLDIKGDHRIIAQKLLRIWGDTAFEGCAFIGKILVEDATSSRRYDPSYFTLVQPALVDGSATDLTVEFKPQSEAGSYVWICLTMVDKNGVHTPVGEHHHLNVWPLMMRSPVQTFSALPTSEPMSPAVPNVSELPADAHLEQGIDGWSASRRDFQTPDPQRSDTISAKSGGGGWMDSAQLLKVCARPTLRAIVDGKPFPAAHGEDVFSKQFYEAFPEVAAELRHAKGQGLKKRIPVKFEGIDTSAIGSDLAMVPGYDTSNPGIHQNGGSGTVALAQFGSYVGPAYAEVMQAYGPSHEGGWAALNTYDGPKPSIGMMQLIFGPTGGKHPALHVASGNAFDFMQKLADTDPACFKRLFGRYGYRISRGTRTVTTTAKNGNKHTSTVTVVKFWRLPCCPSSGQSVTEAATDGDDFDPPDQWLVRRGETASVGFVGLVLQAFADDGFNRALARFFASKIDAEAAKLPADKRTYGEVAKSLYKNFVKPSKPYKLDCESHPRDAWNAIFQPDKQE